MRCARCGPITQRVHAPADACISYRTLYQALQGFEADLHQHIHKENNILFPRAAAMESANSPGFEGTRLQPNSQGLSLGGHSQDFYMQYKKLWIAMGVVMFDFICRAGRRRLQGDQQRTAHPVAKSSPPTAACSSPAKPSATARTSGSPPADRRSALSGATAPMSRPTGAPTISTASRSSFSTAGRKQQGAATYARPACRAACCPSGTTHAGHPP